MSTIDQHIAVMLYLNILSTGNSYNMAEFDALYRANSPQVNDVFQNPALLSSVISDFEDDVPHVIIPDKDQLWVP